jgi:ribonuclease Z
VLVHEVFVPDTLQRAGVPAERIKNIVAYHLTPEQAGEVFAETKLRLAVYSHICMPSAQDEELLAPTRKTFSGPLELGEDLMTIEVGESINVRRPVDPHSK